MLTILGCFEASEGLLGEEVVTLGRGNSARVERIATVGQLIRPADIAADTGT